MSRKKAPSLSAYQKLLSRIQHEIDAGLKAIEHQKIKRHWNIGGYINAFLNGQTNPYGTITRFYEEFSKDSEIHIRTLQQCQQFHRYFPVIKPHRNLNWSHYRFLLTELDNAKRQAWLARIIKEKIPADQLRLMLSPPGTAVVDLSRAHALGEPVRGKLYIYRLQRAEDIGNFDVPWFVDIGFAGRVEAPQSSAVLDNKYLYTSVKTKKGYHLKVTNAKASDLFTFRAVKKRLIDADTPVVDIDLGFSCWSHQTLRLKGIDAPELSKLAGQRAKKWVEEELKDCPEFVVKTYKSDKWDRYLVDVFYLPKETDLCRIAAEGIWLNKRMVEAGIAKIWTEKDKRIIE